MYIRKYFYLGTVQIYRYHFSGEEGGGGSSIARGRGTLLFDNDIIFDSIKVFSFHL